MCERADLMDGVGEERLELDLGLLADVIARVPA